VRKRAYLPDMTETSPVSDFAASPCAIRLDDRRLIAVTGADAAGFLNGLVTAQIAALPAGTGTLAALLTPQGKIMADMLVFNASDEEPLYLLDVHHGHAEALLGKLALYRLRAHVGIDLLPAPTAVMVCLDAPAITGEAYYSFPDPRAATLGQRLYGPADALAAATGTLPTADAAFYHRRRRRLVLPEGGHDYPMLDAFPHEANFDQLGGIDFTKGCYLGQEVVSRMQHRGSARTRALGVRFIEGFGASGGAEITAGETLLGRIGESSGDRAIGFVRLDRLAEAAERALPVLAGGMPVVLERPAYANFTVASIGIVSHP
jgi:tRNA-modifying protein YgfZ